jgi:Uma2 family endonuclease
VSANPIPRLFTVEEYEQIPDPPGGRYELHHGELVFVTYPVREHGDLQRRLRKILENAGEPLGYVVATEYPYRPLPQSEVWGADVACVALARHKATKKWLLGSPELVIEVKSPSNTKHQLHDKAMTTLAGEGAVEFWIVDAKTRSVQVYSKTAGTLAYRAPESVPVPLLNCEVSLADLFADF